jgi:hypothetical protein
MKLAWVFVILTASRAFAQAPDEGAPPPPPAPAPAEPMPPPPPPTTAPPGMTMTVAPTTPPVPAETPSTVDKGTLEDANAGRIAIMPTALTPPKGTLSFEDWELFLITVTYAVTDQFVISGTTMVPVTSDFYWGFISGKLQVAKSGNLRLALQAGMGGVLDNNVASSGMSDSAGGFDLGGALTYCFDVDCYSHFDAAAVAAFARQGNSSVPVGFSAGVVARVSPKVRLIAEADTAHLFGELNEQADGFLGWYGVRFTSRQIGVDLALVKPFCSDCSSDGAFPLGFPFLTFSYRSL